MNDGRLTRFKSFLKCNQYYDHYYNHDCVIINYTINLRQLITN